MPTDLANIHSLSDFQRNTKLHLRKLKKSGKPAILTVNGQAEVAVQSAAAYQQLLDSSANDSSPQSLARGAPRA